MKAEFDVVLVDTSAARPYADSQCVAFRTGSAIVLARKDHTRIGDTQGVIRQLSDAGVRVVGTVLNAF
jgi:receptor protein-tyrosine kinase